MSSGGQAPGKSSSEVALRDLKHFLTLASLKLRSRLKEIEASEPYSGRVNKMRMLEELIKEQMPNENCGSSTGSSR